MSPRLQDARCAQGALRAGPDRSLLCANTSETNRGLVMGLRQQGAVSGGLPLFTIEPLFGMT
jgi:hypothetical protein